MVSDSNGIELKDLSTEQTTVSLDDNANNKIDISLSDKEDKDTVSLQPEPTSSSTNGASASTIGASGAASNFTQSVRNVMGDSAGNGFQAVMGNPMIANMVLQVKSKLFDNGEGGIDSIDVGSGLMNAKIVLRPWLSEFAQVRKPVAFEPAQLVKNMNYFRWNYVVVTFAVLVLGLLMSPTALLSLLLSAGAWLYFLHKNANPDWAPVIPVINKVRT